MPLRLKLNIDTNNLDKSLASSLATVQSLGRELQAALNTISRISSSYLNQGKTVADEIEKGLDSQATWGSVLPIVGTILGALGGGLSKATDSLKRWFADTMAKMAMRQEKVDCVGAGMNKSAIYTYNKTTSHKNHRIAYDMPNKSRNTLKNKFIEKDATLQHTRRVYLRHLWHHNYYHTMT